jgi:hypothetical protein
MTQEELRDLRWKERLVHVTMTASVLAFFLVGLVHLT